MLHLDLEHDFARIFRRLQAVVDNRTSATWHVEAIALVVESDDAHDLGTAALDRMVFLNDPRNGERPPAPVIRVWGDLANACVAELMVANAQGELDRLDEVL